MDKGDRGNMFDPCLRKNIQLLRFDTGTDYQDIARLETVGRNASRNFCCGKLGGGNKRI